MPIRKPRLSRQEEAEYLLCLQQLQGEGHDVEIPDKWRENAAAVDIEVGAPWENMVFDLTNGGVGYYAVRLRLIARRPGVILLEYAITSDFDDQILLLNIDERNPFCKLGRFEFERREILNSRVDNELRLQRRGQMVQGWLLASGLSRIPPQDRDGAKVPFQLTFRDQFQQETGVHGTLSVFRAPNQKNPVVRPWTGLDGPAENQQFCASSVSEESVRQCRELVAQEKAAEERTEPATQKAAAGT